MALLGAAGRGSSYACRYGITPGDDREVTIIRVQTIDEFIADPANA
jgi:hypothetical protein